MLVFNTIKSLDAFPRMEPQPFARWDEFPPDGRKDINVRVACAPDDGSDDDDEGDVDTEKEDEAPEVCIAELPGWNYAAVLRELAQNASDAIIRATNKVPTSKAVHVDNGTGAVFQVDGLYAGEWRAFIADKAVHVVFFNRGVAIGDSAFVFGDSSKGEQKLEMGRFGDGLKSLLRFLYSRSSDIRWSWSAYAHDSKRTQRGAFARYTVKPLRGNSDRGMLMVSTHADNSRHPHMSPDSYIRNKNMTFVVEALTRLKQQGVSGTCVHMIVRGSRGAKMNAEMTHKWLKYLQDAATSHPFLTPAAVAAPKGLSFCCPAMPQTLPAAEWS
jgi:hypothetical protein